MISIYRKTILNEVIKINKIYTIHFYEYTKDFSYAGEEHNFWEFVYVDSGEVRVLADTKRYTLSQGSVIFHKPNEYHGIWAAEKFATVVVISFECLSSAMSFFENRILLVDQHGSAIISNIISEARKTFAEPLNIVELEKMTPLKNAPFGSRQIIKLRLEEFLVRLIRANNVVKNEGQIFPKTSKPIADDSVFVEKDGREQQIVDRINRYLIENIHNRVTLDQICSKFSFSKTYLKNTYKKISGESVIDNFINLKIEEAKRMISEKQYNISEIAELLSFNSVHYFSRCFKKRTNMSPSEYARSVKSKKML